MEIVLKANYSQFSIFSYGGHFVHRSETILAILVEGHLNNTPMKFERNLESRLRSWMIYVLN